MGGDAILNNAGADSSKGFHGGNFKLFEFTFNRLQNNTLTKWLKFCQSITLDGWKTKLIKILTDYMFTSRRGI